MTHNIRQPCYGATIVNRQLSLWLSAALLQSRLLVAGLLYRLLS